MFCLLNMPTNTQTWGLVTRKMAQRASKASNRRFWVYCRHINVNISGEKQPAEKRPVNCGGKRKSVAKIFLGQGQAHKDQHRNHGRSIFVAQRWVSAN